MKLLIFGLPGSGKSTLAEPLAKKLDGVWLNADQVRKKYKDWDFTIEGRTRQALRMKHLSEGIVMAGKVAVVDFICPTKEARQLFEPDYTVWMDTIRSGRYDDTNKIFEKPEINTINYHVAKWFDDTPEQLEKVFQNFVQRQYEDSRYV